MKMVNRLGYVTPLEPVVLTLEQAVEELERYKAMSAEEIKLGPHSSDFVAWRTSYLQKQMIKYQDLVDRLQVARDVQDTFNGSPGDTVGGTNTKV